SLQINAFISSIGVLFSFSINQSSSNSRRSLSNLHDLSAITTAKGSKTHSAVDVSKSYFTSSKSSSVRNKKIFYLFFFVWKKNKQEPFFCGAGGHAKQSSTAQ